MTRCVAYSDPNFQQRGPNTYRRRNSKASTRRNTQAVQFPASNIHQFIYDESLDPIKNRIVQPHFRLLFCFAFEGDGFATRPLACRCFGAGFDFIFAFESTKAKLYLVQLRAILFACHFAWSPPLTRDPRPAKDHRVQSLV